MLKKAAYVLLSVIALIIVGIGILLAPAHWQIRHLEVRLPSLAALQREIDSIDVAAADYPTEIRYLLTGSQSAGTREVAYAAVAIRWPDGRIFMIDAGMDPNQAAQFGRTMELIGNASPVVTFGSVNDQMGKGISSISGIGFTHLHDDHTLGITDLCAATQSRATIYRTSNQVNLQNLHTKNGSQLIATAACSKAVLNNDPIKKVPGFPGLYAIDAGGHTPCSTLYVVRLRDKTVIFVGDLTSSKTEIENDAAKPMVYSYLLVPENRALLAEWRSWLRGALALQKVGVVVAHDLKSYSDAEIKPWAVSKEIE